jgi:hypothetical protein
VFRQRQQTHFTSGRSDPAPAAQEEDAFDLTDELMLLAMEDTSAE